MAEVMEKDDFLEMEFVPGAWFPMGKQGTVWQILDINEEAKRALVLAKDSVAERKYHTKWESITWEKCALRKWLNEDFYKKAFSDPERAAIMEADIHTPDSVKCKTTGGKDTKDHVWLLDIDEAEKYFSSDEERKLGAAWWLRSPGHHQAYAACTAGFGGISGQGYSVNVGQQVRPALYVDLQSEFFRTLLTDDHKIRFPKICFTDGIMTWMYGIVSKENADHVLTAMAEQIKVQKKSARKAAEAAVAFAVEQSVFLTKASLEKLADVLKEKKCEDALEKLLSCGPAAEILNAGEGGQGEGKEENGKEKHLPDGTILYGEVQKKLEAGAGILFGTAFQSWRVLEVNKSEKTALLISEKIAAYHSYHDKNEKVTWEKCALRKWLNTEFLDRTFSEEEKAVMIESRIITPENADYHTKGGDPAKDRLFLLSIDEAEKYLKDDKNETVDQWWLRSPGSSLNLAAQFTAYGGVSRYGGSVNYSSGVRPAVWVDLKSDLFRPVISEDEDGEMVIAGPEQVIRKGTLLSVDPSSEEIEIPSYVTEIPGKVLCMDRKLKKVMIPASVKKADSYAFADCTALEEIVFVNPSFKLEKYAFGSEEFREPRRKLPNGLKTGSMEWAVHLAPEDVRVLVAIPEIWFKLSASQKARVFIENQSDALLKAYQRIISEKNSEGMPEELAKQAGLEHSAKEFNAMAKFMTEFNDLLSAAEVKKIYQAFGQNKKAAAALKTVQASETVMALVNASEEDPAGLTKEMQILKTGMEALHLSDRSLKVRLKDCFGLELNDLPQMTYTDGKEADPRVLALLLTAHESPNPENAWRMLGIHETGIYTGIGVRKEAKPVLALLDAESFLTALRTLADTYLVVYQNQKPKYLSFPICRYADEMLMTDLTRRAPGWATSVSGIDASPLRELRTAALFSDTFAAMVFADKYHSLDDYASLRGKTEDDIRDEYLSDVGIDEKGRKEYDLGKQKVTAVLQKDMSFLIETEGGKTMKSVPKRDSDPVLYEAAVEDIKQMRAQAKKIIKNRSEKLFEDFLSGRGRSADGWKKAYFGNPLLCYAAEHIVWSQGENTFTVLDRKTVYVDGMPYEILADTPVKVAHPMEMKEAELSAWRKYFAGRKITQPFEQVWEPAYKKSEISEDRYQDCTIFWRRVQNANKHGIHFFDEDFHNNVGFELDDCRIEYELQGKSRHEIAEDARFVFGKFNVDTFNRKVNHIVYLLDKWTIWDRIRKDDIKVMETIDHYTAAQIIEFINLASESEAVQLTAALMSYKEEHFKDYSAFDEFVLEW